MADFGPELEDGERYLPAGILLGDDGWEAGGQRLRNSFSQRPRLVSDRPGDFVCHRPELSRRLLKSAELSELPVTRRGVSQKPHADLCAAYLQQWFWKGSPRVPAAARMVLSGCPCEGNASCPALGRHLISAPGDGIYAVSSGLSCSFPPIRSCRAQVENCVMREWMQPIQARGFPYMESSTGRDCGGTGFFLPLYQSQCESRKPHGRRREGDVHKQKLYAVVAKNVTPLQPQAEVGLPRDWTY